MGNSHSEGMVDVIAVTGVYKSQSSGQEHVNPVFDSSESCAGDVESSSTAQVPQDETTIEKLEAQDVPMNSHHQNALMKRLSVGDKSLSEENEDYLLGKAGARKDETPPDGCEVLVAEVVPSNSTLIEVMDERGWKMSIEEFSSKKQPPGDKHPSKRIKSYYKAQDELIKLYEMLHQEVESDSAVNDDRFKKLVHLTSLISRITLIVNMVLLVGKAVASALSGSIAIISSLIDSIVDLLSGILMWWASRAIKKRNYYVYPQGRTKLEPVAIIILSVIMAVASLQLIRESVVKIADLAAAKASLPSVEITTFVIAGVTIVAKLIMWIIYRRIPSPTVQALAQDGFNDVLSNSVAIICGYLGSKNFKEKVGLGDFVYVDPAGAIVISLYIIYNWWRTGKQQIKLLTGYTASPQLLSKLTWMVLNHHSAILYVDTVRAFHFGNNFLVEVHVILPESMPLKDAHNIGEELQNRLERQPEVERAFVHLDYEFLHDPFSEHKRV